LRAGLESIKKKQFIDPEALKLSNFKGREKFYSIIEIKCSQACLEFKLSFSNNASCSEVVYLYLFKVFSVTIYYKKKNLKFQLFYGILSAVIGVIGMFLEAKPLMTYPWLVLGILQIGTSYYQYKYQYLKIENNILTKNSLISKSIDLRELTAIRKFRNSFVLESKDQEIRIYKHLIATDSLYKLTDLLNELQIEPQQV